jgi:hypothetical protein
MPKQNKSPVPFCWAFDMSPLATAIYKILRRRARLPEPRVTYAELAEELRDLGDEFEFVHHRNQQLYAALGEVGNTCRRLRLPSLPALVVRADTKRPGSAYFAGKCRGIVYKGEQISAWWREVEAVKQSRYPAPSKRA